MKHTTKILVVSVAALAALLCRSAAQPLILEQPADQFPNSGQNAAFSVSASGTGTLSYQWLFNGKPIAGKTAATLSMVRPVREQWGDYSVSVTDSSGSVTSRVARLKVFVPSNHGFERITRDASGTVSLTFAGEASNLYAHYYDLFPVESSDDLVSWSPVGLLQRPNSSVETLEYTDAAAGAAMHRFYRTPVNSFPTADPLPTGKFPVGTFSVLLADPSRTNAAGRTNYKFMATFWYPAKPTAGQVPARHLESAVANGGTYNFFGLPGGSNFSSHAIGLYSPCFSNAPVAETASKLPIVLYDPGYGGMRRENEDKTAELASWGYVVVAVDTSDSLTSVFPDGRVFHQQAVDMSDTKNLVADIEQRVLDLQFVMDQAAEMNETDSRFAGRLDLNRIGGFGWSLGGATLAQLCLRDPRCKAGAGFDGYFLETNLLTQELKFPFLYFISDARINPDPLNDLPGMTDDRFRVYQRFSSNAYWIKLSSTLHGSFADYDRIVDGASLESYWGLPASGELAEPARVTEIVRSCLLSFFNKFLKGEDDHLLRNPQARFPEIKQFLGSRDEPLQPVSPSGALVQGDDGWLYGVSQFGGQFGRGAIFRFSPTNLASVAVVASFNGTNGSTPMPGLTRGSDEDFFGTTVYGGEGENGTVFQLEANGAIRTLARFDGVNGSQPFGGLVWGQDGQLYGTTASGGANGKGTVFKVSLAGELTTVVSFDGTNGASPYAALLVAPDGTFFGTTSIGGAASGGGGTVFKLTMDGTLTTLVRFNGSNGRSPAAPLVFGGDGFIYGTTVYGGNLNLNAEFGAGTVFRVSTAGKFTRLAAFDGRNGAFCAAGLTENTEGDFYGATAGGGPRGGGTIFKISPSGVLAVLAGFDAATASGPQGPLYFDADGSCAGTLKFATGGTGGAFTLSRDGQLSSAVLGRP